MAQSKHDVKVKEKANSLKRQGWKVKADALLVMQCPLSLWLYC